MFKEKNNVTCFNHLNLKSLLVLFMVVAIPLSANSAPGHHELVTGYESFLGSSTSTGQTKTFSLTAAVTQLSIGSGKPISVWAYNEQIPGPILRVNKGDRVKVLFQNNLPESSTIHWHGIRVPNNMDGVPNLTQAPVEPGESFTYEFQAVDSGTYWFHPHSRTHEQLERGLYGILIVEDPEHNQVQGQQYDQEWVWVLDDWLLDSDGAIDDSFEIGDLDAGGRLGNLLSINGKELPSYQAKTGERIRLRIINVSNARNYKLDFGPVKTSIFAVDGNISAQAQNVATFDITPGNRIDVDLTIPASLKSANAETLIKVNNLFSHREASGDVPNGVQTLATIKVLGKVNIQKDFPVPSHDKLPDWDNAHNTPIDFSFEFDSRINFNFLWTDNPLTSYVINGKTYGEHEVTTLKKGEFYHLRFTNGTGLYHPIHMHGVFYKVLSRNGVKVNEPYFRDTALLDYNSSIEIGVVPLDVGSWVMHCHMLEHAALGMMTVFDVIE